MLTRCLVPESCGSPAKPTPEPREGRSGDRRHLNSSEERSCGPLCRNPKDITSERPSFYIPISSANICLVNKKLFPCGFGSGHLSACPPLGLSASPPRSLHRGSMPTAPGSPGSAPVGSQPRPSQGAAEASPSLARVRPCAVTAVPWAAWHGTPSPRCAPPARLSRTAACPW